MYNIALAEKGALQEELLQCEEDKLEISKELVEL